MSHLLPTPLPAFDRKLMRVVERIVPTAGREEWRRGWQAELWHMHDRRVRSDIGGLAAISDLAIGLIRDALWLRSDSLRRRYSGTAALCLASLFGLSLLAALMALLLAGSWQSLGDYLSGLLIRSMIGALLVLFVAFATASRRHIEPGAKSRRLFWIRRQLFFAVKIVQVLLLTFLLSADLSEPAHASLPNTTDVFQLLCFVLLALVGLRWAFRDQEERCKQCLHALATPARVGRPSRNLLEWNGSELSCKHGHGLLSIPEMETSWCQSSRWVELTPVWDETVRLDGYIVAEG